VNPSIGFSCWLIGFAYIGVLTIVLGSIVDDVVRTRSNVLYTRRISTSGGRDHKKHPFPSWLTPYETKRRLFSKRKGLNDESNKERRKEG
jgi:hypothetical protein